MEPAVYTAGQIDSLAKFFRANGYAVLRGLFDEDALDALQAECVRLQGALVRGELPARPPQAARVPSFPTAAEK